jgi:hypothetical protein
MILPYFHASGVLLVVRSKAWGQAIVWQQGQHCGWVGGSWDSHSLFVIGGVVGQNLVGFGNEVEQEGGVYNSFSKVFKFIGEEAAELCQKGEDECPDAQMVGDDITDVCKDVSEHQPGV